jgi:N-acetylneuraminic acid mutarotase
MNSDGSEDVQPAMNARPSLLLIGLLVSLVAVPLTTAASSGTWSPAGSMTSPRALHQATLLADGRVLVTGGNNPDVAALRTADVHTPSTNTWTPAASMTTGRSRHTATLLADGRVLVAGGRDASGASLRTAELYDPATDNWTPTGSMATRRDNYRATRLLDGRVLVAGGVSIDPAAPPSGPAITNTAEIYDPNTGTWTHTDHMTNARWGHSMTLLPDGRVLVAGGNTRAAPEEATRTAEIYDPATGAWSPTGNMNIARAFHAATLLADGRVLVAGGITRPHSDLTATAELYDSLTGRWTETGSLAVARGGHGFSASRLASGKVLIEGAAAPTATAEQRASAELYDPLSGSWSFTGSMSVGRGAQAAVSLADGRVLVTGGVNFDNGAVVLTSTEVYTP